MQLSIVIPCYNNSAYLRECIESAIETLQGQDGEVVLVDDFSTDSSYDIARDYEDQIRVYRNETNVGQELTTNRGLELATGKFAVILHSDDVLHNNFAADLLDLFERCPSAVMAVGERQEITASGDVQYAPPPFYDGDYLVPGIEQAKIFLISSFLPCQVIFDREIVLSFGGAERFFSVNLDGLLWFKTSLFGDVAYIQNLVCSYRKHSTSTTSGLNRSVSHMFEYYCTQKRMFDFAQEQGFDFEPNRPRSFMRVSELALRYGKEISADGDHETSKSYLLVAESINPQIRENSAFIEVDEANNTELELSTGISVRSISYPPPSGSHSI